MSCEGGEGIKCRDALEPESIQKCRGLCLNSIEANNNNNNDSLLLLLQPESDVNNEIFASLPGSSSSLPPTPRSDEESSRPNTTVSDKIQPDNLQVMEMEYVTNPTNDFLSNEVEPPLSDEPVHVYKKMSIHIGQEAADFLAKIQHHPPAIQADQPADLSPIDVSKMKPNFKWKIGLWTKVIKSCFYRNFYHLLNIFVLQCSVRCDGGTRVRDVSCYEITTSTLVDDALCTDLKPDDVESCNEV